MKLSRVLALAAAVLLVSSCAQGVPGKPALVPSEPPEGPGVLGGTQWRLSELNGRGAGDREFDHRPVL